jgi:glycosyltransferase involved in cell wall biosynthesis
MKAFRNGASHDIAKTPVMGTIRISIAMCTFNGARYLSEQLSSIASQTTPPDELIVCDDGSVDDTIRILSTFATQVPFDVRVFENEARLGPVKNFEKAISLCRGEIIALCDQDDVWKPHKLATLLEAFRNDPEAVYAFSDAEMVDEGGGPLGSTLWDAVGLRKNLPAFSGPGQLEMLLRKSLVTGAAMAFRSSFREVVLPIPLDWMHDGWIATLGSALSRGVAVSDTLLLYRRHAGQACGWRSKTFWQVFKISLSVSGKESWQKVEQYREFHQRVLSASASTKPNAVRLQLLREKETHLTRRAETRSASGISRVWKVIAELYSGRYGRFSESFWYSIMRDLC